MRDLLHQNYGAMTGTPALVTGPLSTLNDQALSFNGTTNSMTVPDSPSDSLAVADGGAGGMALSIWVKFVSLPGSQKSIFDKSGIQFGITATNKFYFFLLNGANSVTVNSVASAVAGQWYHVVCVYNGDYSGTPIFGNQTQGSVKLPIPADYRQGVATGARNLQVCHFPILEKGVITSVVMDLVRTHDATSPEWLAGVAYNVDAGLTTALGGQSAPRLIQPSDTRAWEPFPMAAPVYPGDVAIGFIAGSGSAEFSPISIGYETSGGTCKEKAAVVTGGDGVNFTGTAPDPFGTPGASNSQKFAVYANYTPTGRTGAEGRALIYVNGQLDNFSAYTHGIADSANDILFASGTAVQIGGRPAIFNRKLSPVEVSYLYSAR
jgi:hypothetical protein